MMHLKRFNEGAGRISIFDSEWTKLLPSKLTIVTDNGEFELSRKNSLEKNTGYPEQIYNLMTSVSISYSQDTVSAEEGDPLADGEPTNLQFDIHMVKDNKGDSANPETLRLNVDMTYGDNMQSAFTIERDAQGKTKVAEHHYTGKNSIYDSETFFGFTRRSLSDLVAFFNRFGFESSVEDFKFIDDDPEDYAYSKREVRGKEVRDSARSEEEQVLSLKGGNKILRYNDMDHYKVDIDGIDRNI